MQADEAMKVIAEGAQRGISPVRALRDHTGLSVEALAEQAGFEVALLTACEEHHGVAAPAPCFKETLARALGVPMDVLFPLSLKAA